MKKNLLVTSLVALATIATLSGCGNSVAKPNFVIPEGGYDGSEVTITFYHTMSATTLQPTLEKCLQVLI